MNTMYKISWLETTQMQGTAAQTNMTGFDFGTMWQTVTGDYPILQDNPE